MQEQLTFLDESVWRAFFKPGEITEIRIPKARDKSPAWGNEYAHGTVFGYFDAFEPFRKAIESANKEKHGGIYITPQILDPCLLGRSYNRLRPTDTTTSDNNVIAYRWLLVDLDPVRLSGISSSDTELAAALELRDVVAKYAVHEMGFSRPISAMSGNGAHLLFRLPDIPVNDESKKMISGILTGLARRFDTDRVKIDTTVFNPSRIWKCYGTLARKGDAVPAGPHREARPHRMSFIEDMGGNT